MKWMKIAGYVVLISFIIVSIKGLFDIIQLTPYQLNLYNNLLNLTLSIFLFIGFLTLGRFSKNKLLINVTWLILLINILISFFWMIVFFNPSYLLFFVTNYSLSINLNTFLMVLLPSGIHSILEILLGVSLLNIKKVRFTKIVGIITIFIGVLYSIFYFIISPLILSIDETSTIYYFLFNLLTPGLTFSSSSILFFILGMVFLFLAILKSAMFFNASEKFEK